MDEEYDENSEYLELSSRGAKIISILFRIYSLSGSRRKWLLKLHVATLRDSPWNAQWDPDGIFSVTVVVALMELLDYSAMRCHCRREKTNFHRSRDARTVLVADFSERAVLFTATFIAQRESCLLPILHAISPYHGILMQMLFAKSFEYIKARITSSLRLREFSLNKLFFQFYLHYIRKRPRLPWRR